ncbi:hypothetical protein [Hymenobacter rubripertinctus]|uniref:Uncharacterized protein n=1 Tax=Hymenobacter rubripertinctus TaxID=2029981 RepID=A0A418QN25_9BACT|nr:hypothetical protein [Hymenobacter rubripertinctus]RIY06480.1 hypothetical protein D0T11_18745 [Hymenobacter rubripertinctus]
MNPIQPAQLKVLHLLLKECDLVEMKTTLVGSFTSHRATSSKDMTEYEAQCLVDYLKAEHNGRCKKMRGKIIHYLTLLGYVLNDQTPDWRRINEFVKAIGSNNPRKVQLNFLYHSELPKVVSQVEAMYKHEIKRLKP